MFSKNKFKYQEIIELIIEQIENGILSPGDKIYSRNQMENEYHISSDTVNRAVNQLVEMGYIEKIKGKGTFVAGRIKSANIKSNIISLIIPFLVQKFDETQTFETSSANMHPIITQEILHYIANYGYNLQLSIPNQIKNINSYLDDLINGKVDGILYFDDFMLTSKERIEKIKAVMKFKRPFIMLDTYLSNTDVSYVCTDNFSGVFEMCQELYKRGYERIIGISADYSISSINDREAGYKAFLRTHNISGEIIVFSEINQGYITNSEVLNRIFNSDQKTAVISFTPTIARYFWNMALKFNCNMSQIAWASFDKPNINYPKGIVHCDIVQDLINISKVAIDSIIDLIENKVDSVKEQIKPHIIFYD